MGDTELGTILVVEDDIGVANLERRCLERAGYATLGADNAADALVAIQREKVDLVILDYALPGNVNGIELYESLKAAGHRLPVIMVTGFSDEETVIRALRAGVRDFVSKSLAYLDYLPEAVDRVLRQVGNEQQLVEAQTKLSRTEQELADVFENAAIGLRLVNGDGIILRANHVQFELLGYSRAEYVGHHIAEFHADPAVGADILRRMQAGESLTNYAARLRCKDGSVKDVEIDSTSRCENGRLIYTRCCTRDITAWKHTQEALDESNERFRQLAETIEDAFWITSTDGQQVLYVNPAYEKIWRRPVKELAENAQAWLDAVHVDDRMRVRQAFHELLSCGKYDEEYRIVRPDGSIRWIKNRGFVICNEARQPCRLAGVAEDITQAKWAEQRLARHAADLAQSNAELEQFAYVASHDLQEPLRKVSSFCQLLHDRYTDQLDADAKQYIAYAVEGAKRMKRLITELLDYSRIGRQGEPLGATDAQAACNRAIENQQATIAETGGTVSCDPLPVVIGNELMLVRLFQNLIGNGLKFRSERRPDIHLGAAREAGQWVFSVRDNGIGIAQEYWKRIFVVFQRLHSATEYSGTGIGLAVCKRIVERLGGRIWIDSEPGHGSTFYFTLASASEEVHRPEARHPQLAMSLSDQAAEYVAE